MSDSEKIIPDDKKKLKKVEKKPSFISKIGRWLREMRSELRKVVWPTIPQLTNNTIIVLVSVVVVGAVVSGLDVIFLFIVNALTGIFKG